MEVVKLIFEVLFNLFLFSIGGFIILLVVDMFLDFTVTNRLKDTWRNYTDKRLRNRIDESRTCISCKHYSSYTGLIPIDVEGVKFGGKEVQVTARHGDCLNPKNIRTVWDPVDGERTGYTEGTAKWCRSEERRCGTLGKWYEVKE